MAADVAIVGLLIVLAIVLIAALVLESIMFTDECEDE
jgi:hypothetical protein